MYNKKPGHYHESRTMRKLVPTTNLITSRLLLGMRSHLLKRLQIWLFRRRRGIAHLSISTVTQRSNCLLFFAHANSRAQGTTRAPAGSSALISTSSTRPGTSQTTPRCLVPRQSKIQMDPTPPRHLRLRSLERGLQDLHPSRRQLRSRPRPSPPSTPAGWPERRRLTRRHVAHDGSTSRV